MKLNIGENLRRLRRAADMTQERLADKLGVAYQSVSRWENGTTYPDMEMLPALSSIFGVTVDELLGMEESKKKEQISERYVQYFQICESDISDPLTVVSLLRELRRDCVADPALARYMWQLFSGVHWGTDTVKTHPNVIAELRITAKEILDGHYDRWMKDSVVEYMSHIEDDEHIEAFLDRYATEKNLTKEMLLYNRYRDRNEWDKSDPLRQKRLLGNQSVRTGRTGMDLIINQMVQLQIVGITNGNQIIERLTGTAIIQDSLAILTKASQLQSLADILLVSTVEHGSGHVPAQSLSGITQVDFQNLTDVHTGRHAQGVQNHIQGGTVGQEGHIFLRQDAGNNALVTVTTGHLIADGDLSLLGDVNADGLGNAGSQLIGILLGEDLDIHNNAALTVGNLQRGITDFSCLLTEDGPQQTLFRGQLSLTLGGDLTNQIVTGTNLSTNTNDAVLVQILQSIFANIGDIASDLFGSQLGVPSLGLVLLDVDGSKDIFLDQTLIQQNGVLVVVTFPGNEADEHVLTQSDFAAGAGRTVCNDLLSFHMLANFHDGTLVNAGAGIAAGHLW